MHWQRQRKGGYTVCATGCQYSPLPATRVCHGSNHRPWSRTTRARSMPAVRWYQPPERLQRRHSAATAAGASPASDGLVNILLQARWQSP